MIRIPRPIVIGSLAVAILDGLDPVIFYGLRGVPAGQIFQGIAGGLLGREASIAAGTPTVFLGMAIHLFIASVVVTTYWLASQKIPALVRRPILYGMLYGLVVYAVMNYFVIPLSALGTGLKVPTIRITPGFLNGIFATLFCIGIPTGLAARAARLRGSPASAGQARVRI
jgi:hypothetical protein